MREPPSVRNPDSPTSGYEDKIHDDRNGTRLDNIEDGCPFTPEWCLAKFSAYATY